MFDIVISVTFGVNKILTPITWQKGKGQLFCYPSISLDASWPPIRQLWFSDKQGQKYWKLNCRESEHEFGPEKQETRGQARRCGGGEGETELEWFCVDRESGREKEKQKKGGKRVRFERHKEKALLIFTDSQPFLNILLLPAVWC